MWAYDKTVFSKWEVKRTLHLTCPETDWNEYPPEGMNPSNTFPDSKGNTMEACNTPDDKVGPWYRQGPSNEALPIVTWTRSTVSDTDSTTSTQDMSITMIEGESQDMDITQEKTNFQLIPLERETSEHTVIPEFPLLENMTPRRLLRSPPRLPEGMILQVQRDSFLLQGHSGIQHPNVSLGTNQVPRNAATFPSELSPEKASDNKQALLDYLQQLHTGLGELWGLEHALEKRLTTQEKTLQNTTHLLQETQETIKQEMTLSIQKRVKDDTTHQNLQNSTQELHCQLRQVCTNMQTIVHHQ